MAISLLTSTILSAAFSQTASGYPFTIVAVGDWDCNSDTKKTVTNVQKQNPDIVLALGDLSYQKKADCWLDIIAPIKDKMLIVQGNHDDNFEDYMKAFGMTNSWTSVEVPAANAVFVGVNTEESLKEGSQQLKFLDKTLTDSQAAWKITFMHKPSITYGHHMSDEGAPETLLPLYDKTKTSIEFSGHNHFMQEIYPTADGSGEPHKAAAGEGTAHIVSGGGGRDLYEYEDNDLVAQSLADHGIVKTVLLDDKNAKSEFISNDGKVTKMGDIINRNYKEPTQPLPPTTPPTEPEPTPEPPIVLPTTNTTQLLISNNIENTETKGEYDNQDYIVTYNVRNLFDNLTNSWSFWSQYGKSGFAVDLEKPLDKPLCKIELDAYNPQSQPYKLAISDSNNNKLLEYSDSIKTVKTIIDIQGCLSNVDKLGMDFDNAGKWATFSEMKLFTNSSVITVPPTEPPETTEPPIVTPPIEPPQQVVNGTINIVNSTATIKMLNSNLTIIFYDNETLSDWANNITDLNETQIDNSPIEFSSKGGEY